MRSITVLDGHTLNPGDLDWSRLQALGECSIYDRTSPDSVVTRAADAQIVLTNKTVLDRPSIERLTALQYIGVLATGYNIVDVQAAADRGIAVTNVPTYGTQSVAQMVFAHLLNFTQHTAEHSCAVREGRWSDCPDFCFWDFPLVELAGLTMGIVGYGRIGRATARLARAFDMKVIAYESEASARDSNTDARFVELETLLTESDVVSLHCPLTPQTKNLITSERLSMMKSSAFLINTSRGPLIDDTALAIALNQGTIAGAGLDVLPVEPPPANNPLFAAKNCYITPHIAWGTRAARSRLLTTAIENVEAFVAGEPRNMVSPTPS